MKQMQKKTYAIIIVIIAILFSIAMLSVRKKCLLFIESIEEKEEMVIDIVIADTETLPVAKKYNATPYAIRELGPKEDEIQQEEKTEYIFDVTEEDIKLLEYIVTAEDGNESQDKQVATAATILNRLESDVPGFEKLTTLEEVIFQKGQFSTVRDGKIYGNSTEITAEMVSEDTKQAVQRALLGEDPTEELLRQEAEKLGLDDDTYVANGALFFYSPRWMTKEALEDRAKILVQVQYGEHVFYTYWNR